MSNGKTGSNSGGGSSNKGGKGGMDNTTGTSSGGTTGGGDGFKGRRVTTCSFCGKSQHEVRKLIAGPSVFICDECVDLCNDIIREEVQESAADGAKNKLPRPREICQIQIGRAHV